MCRVWHVGLRRTFMTELSYVEYLQSFKQRIKFHYVLQHMIHASMQVTSHLIHSWKGSGECAECLSSANDVLTIGLGSICTWGHSARTRRCAVTWLASNDRSPWSACRTPSLECARFLDWVHYARTRFVIAINGTAWADCFHAKQAPSSAMRCSIEIL